MPIEVIARGCNINRCRRRMLRATVAWLVQIGSVAALYAPGLANAAALEARTPAELAAMFQADAPGWVIQDHGYGGAASGKWTCALGGDAAWSNYRVDCQIHLAKSADRRDGLELGSFVAFSSHANLGGYEAGLILRRQSPQKFYRVAVSSLWKEIILWRPSGGVVQAVAFPFEIGKTYRLVAECRGPRIAVQVDGKPVIDWWDAADPIASGKVGLARKEGESHFAAVKVEPLDAPAEKAPAHTPRFHERSWHNLRFFFDGDEPLFTLKDDNVLDLMKFRPGYRPILYTLNFITDYVLFSPRQIKQYRLVQDGAQLIIETVAVDPRKKSAVTCDTRLVVSYDAASNLYTYDQTCTTHIPDQEAGKAAAVWDHGDPVFLGGVGGANTRAPNSPRPTYQWTVFQGTDGNFYKVPLNHNLHFDGTAETNGGPVRAGSFGMVAVGDPVLSPLVRIPERSAGFEDKNGFAHCWWAYDIHIGFYPKLASGRGPASHALVERLGRGGFYPPTVNGSVPSGDYRTRVVYSSMNASEAQAILAKAAFYKPHNLDVRIPVYTAGIGFREPFDKTVLLANPHTEHRIWAGRIDDQVGHGDRCSLRLDGPTEAWTQTGGSYFTGAYSKKVRVSGWVKTQNVQGEGPAVGFRRFDNRTAFEFHCTGVTGTTDWTPFSYVTAFPAEFWGVTLFWRNSGTGTVWFDDFKIEPVEDAVAVTARNYPVRSAKRDVTLDAGRDRVPTYGDRPADRDIVLNWNGQGDARGVLDSSGFGSHGKVYDQVAWVEDGGKRVIELSGQSAYIWPLSSPNLTLAPPATLVIRLKPEAPGNLLFWDFNYCLTGTSPQFGVGYQENTLFGKPRGLSDPLVASRPFLQAGKWQTLAIVAADDHIKLYCDGRFIESLPAPLKGGNWGPLAMDDGQGVHRRLSFFGSGPGDALMLASDEIPPTGGGMKGRIAQLVVYRRALSEQEIGGKGDTP
jgi:hypothetical protein